MGRLTSTSALEGLPIVIFNRGGAQSLDTKQSPKLNSCAIASPSQQDCSDGASALEH